MLKRISILLLIALLLAVPVGTALALPQNEEQIVKQEVIMGYFDIWKGSQWQDTNNDGNPDMPGQTGKSTKPFNYSAADELGRYELTRVEVQYPFTPDEYITAGGRTSGPDGQPWINTNPGEEVMPMQKFHEYYLAYLPQNLTVQVTSQDLAAGSATVQWGLDLVPLTSALNIKDEENRRYIGYEPANISNLVEGWRWYLPGIITWYGVPVDGVYDFSVELDEQWFGDIAPGTKIASKVRFKLNEDAPGPAAARLSLVHHVNGTDYNIVLNPAEDVYQPGEVKEYTYSFTAQSVDSEIITTIEPVVVTDPNLENNEDRAYVNIMQPPPPVQPGSANLTAVSQDGSITRPPGTAKWTDRVTCRFTAPTPPVPSRGCHGAYLTSWHLVSAELIVPNKHPNFTFGNPLPPQGTKSIPMRVTGNRTAELTFEQNWGMDGAKIFNPIAGRLMAEHPRQYDLTVRYTVSRSYYWMTSTPCPPLSNSSHCHRRGGSTTDTITLTYPLRLTVDGTGVNSRAQ
ncbi:hypothetical protein [Desulfofalx alkaliphila]|uniref:hypothetical protein n=1 Tax=Desulfofalx alkaliphila TaxID=105483 RepID=UPI0004E1D53D|nr:hypothetical protein [Desulfofalx alkaliphila]